VSFAQRARHCSAVAVTNRLGAGAVKSSRVLFIRPPGATGGAGKPHGETGCAEPRASSASAERAARRGSASFLEPWAWLRALKRLETQRDHSRAGSDENSGD
jgi:hypothetical protein